MVLPETVAVSDDFFSGIKRVKSYLILCGTVTSIRQPLNACSQCDDRQVELLRNN